MDSQEYGNDAVYIRSFLPLRDQHSLLKCIEDVPGAVWKQLKRRRLLNFGGNPSKDFVAEKLPLFCSQLIDARIKSYFPEEKIPNHILINEYQTNEGIMPHKDGPIYHPLVAIISLNTSLLLEFFQKVPHSGSKEPCKCCFFLESGSLILFSEDFYFNLFHGIREEEQFEI